MRLRNIPGAKEAVAASSLVWNETAALEQRGSWQQIFPKTQALHLEIGMGRGLFITTLAKRFPDVNFLGLEIREEMVMQALERLSDAVEPAGSDNLRFLWLNAARMDELFAENEVERIYINFPDPWPKSRHAKRRLTALPLLAIYRKILAPGGEFYFKTDNQPLFDWSVENFTAAGWQLDEVSYDLPLERSIAVTEYENRYRGQGQPIYGLLARNE